MATNPNDSAYPFKGIGPGLTKREYFAAMAMQGTLEDYYADANFEPFSKFAENAVKIADALIKELSK